MTSRWNEATVEAEVNILSAAFGLTESAHDDLTASEGSSELRIEETNPIY